jgi:phosphopantothenoylcysteine decarboxylase/phosphopantothenate--cysteine ligase
MGYAIAEAALDAGHDVVLISGPVNLTAPRNAKFVSVSTSDEMFDAVHEYADQCDVCILCAAVADYRPANVSETKIKKRGEQFSLGLIRTRDILDSLGRQSDRQFLLIGFAAETIANDVSSAKSGMESDVNEVTILFRNGERQRISRAPKKIIARELVKIFHNSATKMFDKNNVMITERN